MYQILYDGNVISKITITDGVSGFSGRKDRAIGDVSPVYHFEYNADKPLLFEHIEDCYALIAFLSLTGFEGMYFRLEYAEDFVNMDEEKRYTCMWEDKSSLPCAMSHEYFSCDECYYAREYDENPLKWGI